MEMIVSESNVRSLIMTILTLLTSLYMGASLAGETFTGKRSYKRPPAQVLTALLFTADLFLANHFFRKVLLKAAGEVWGFWLFCGLCAAEFAVTAALRPAVFPEDFGGYMTAGRGQGKGVRLFLMGMIAGIGAIGLWTGYLCTCGEEFSARVQGILAVLLALLLLLILLVCALFSRLLLGRMEMQVDKKHQEELLNFMQIIRSQRHDFNFHMQAVSGLIENQKYEECENYIHTMVKNVEGLNQMLPFANPAVAALVNAFYELMSTKNIRFENEVLDPLDEIPCTVYEINTIIGNFLQNAIDEVENKEEEKRSVKLLVMKRSRKHIIKVTNSCDRAPEEYRNVFKAGYSTKQSHEGIGLTTVRKITEKYGGIVYAEYEPGIIHFIVKLPVCAQNDSDRQKRNK